MVPVFAWYEESSENPHNSWTEGGGGRELWEARKGSVGEETIVGNFKGHLCRLERELFMLTR